MSLSKITLSWRDYIFSGSVAQQTGLGLPPTVHELSVENPAGVELSNAVSVQRRLVLAGDGDLRLANNNLTLKSSVTGTAMVVNAGAGRVVKNGSGTSHVQRWLDATFSPGLGYHHLSSPVQNTTFADLTTPGFTPVVNPAYNSAPNPVLVKPAPNIFGYNQSRYPASNNFTLGWYSPSALTDPMTPGYSWSVYMTGGLTPDFSGELNTGTIVVPNLIRTGSSLASTAKPGWHLLGNPYPSPIDWDMVSVPNGMSKSISVWKSTGGVQGSYTVYTNGVGALGTDLLGVGQGFFAHVTSLVPVALIFTDACRVKEYANPGVYRSAAAGLRPLMSLQLRAAGATVADEAFVYFEEGATTEVDDAFDATRPGHNVGVPTLAMLVGNEELAINGLSPSTLQAGTTVPLLLDVPATGTYELAVNQLLHLDGQTLVLVGNLTRTRYNLQDRPTIRFRAEAGELRGRFTLELGARIAGVSAAPDNSKLQIWPNPARDHVRVSGLRAGQKVELLDVVGRIVRTVSAPAEEASLPLQDLQSGIYTVRAGTHTQRLELSKP